MKNVKKTSFFDVFDPIFLRSKTTYAPDDPLCRRGTWFLSLKNGVPIFDLFGVLDPFLMGPRCLLRSKDRKWAFGPIKNGSKTPFSVVTDSLRFCGEKVKSTSGVWGGQKNPVFPSLRPRRGCTVFTWGVYTTYVTFSLKRPAYPERFSGHFFGRKTDQISHTSLKRHPTKTQNAKYKKHQIWELLDIDLISFKVQSTGNLQKSRRFLAKNQKMHFFALFLKFRVRN